MPFLQEDTWVSGQAVTYDLSELEDCAVAVDAAYYIKKLLDRRATGDPLLSALGGLTSTHSRMNNDLDLWEKHRITPLFVFDGQDIKGQDDVFLKRARAANTKTDEAWKLYERSAADQAVQAFGLSPEAYSVKNIFPVMQQILASRNLHFLVPPYNACAQLAYFDMVDSDQCAAVMGPQELLLYPIKDSIIQGIDFSAKSVTAVSKQKILRGLGVNENMFIDAMLMTGTSFLNPFPPLKDVNMYPDATTIMDAVNILRTADKSVVTACASFQDILQAQDADWLDRYRKARMAVQHFIYIAENGDITVHDAERLTSDNHEYLGLQLPAELFHYLNTGLIGPRILNCITHSQMVVQPTLDGEASEEYKKLITSQLVQLREQALSLIVPRVHRGIGHKAINMRVWYDPKFSHTFAHGSLQPPPSQKVATWNVAEQDIRDCFPADFAGPVQLEILALANQDFAAKTIAKDKIRGISSGEMVASIAIWRFLHLRGYVGDDHKLTKWGNALATTFLALRDVTENLPGATGLDEAALLAFELVRFGLLNGHGGVGDSEPLRKATVEDHASIVLISQCASLLKLQHEGLGFTGPLNKGLLKFRSLSSAVREANRDLIEAILASMFLYGQCERERSDQVLISQRLPFASEPDIGLGIALRTFLDEDDPTNGQQQRQARLKTFPKSFLPLALAVEDDIRIGYGFFDALSKGVQTLDAKELAAGDQVAWTKAQAFLESRPI